MRQRSNSTGLQADLVAVAFVWHLQSFVRSLQLVIHWIRDTWNRAQTGKTPELIPRRRHDYRSDHALSEVIAGQVLIGVSLALMNEF